MTPEVKRALVATLIARTAANAGVRIVYPFLPVIARGLGVSLTALSALVAARNLGGLATPAAARASERYGRARLMWCAVAAVAAGCVVTAATESFLVAGAGIVVVGLAKPAFDIPMQAWFGDRVPYGERGRVFGITELTWSVALLATVPLSGVLIERTDWRAPFVLVALLASVGTVAILRGIAPDRPVERARFELDLSGPQRRVLFVALLFSIAAEIPFIVYGQWLEGSFGLSVSGIATFTLVVVAAELAGEAAVTAVADRVGLRRMVFVGLAASACAYVGFTFTDTSIVLAVIVVLAWIAAFEVTIVAAIPFVSELAAGARELMLSRFAVMVAGGRAIGALVAQPLYSAGGIGLAGAVSAAAVLVAFLILLAVTEPSPQQRAGASP
jgi:predicted MFS family arabinose efflux permease